MEKLLDTFLESKALNRGKLSKLTGISPTTLQRSSDKDALTINPRIYAGIASVTGLTAGQVFDEVIELEEDTAVTLEEAKFTLDKLFRAHDIEASTTCDDDGILATITLPSKKDVSFSMPASDGKFDEDYSTWDIVQDLSMTISDFDHDSEEDGLLYPLSEESDLYPSTRLFHSEYVGITKPDSDYLSSIGDTIWEDYSK